MLKRLLLLSAFLPLFLAMGVFLYLLFTFGPAAEIWEDRSEWYGLYANQWMLVFTAVVPALLAIWIFLSGSWRKPVLTAGIVYWGMVFVLMAIANGLLPEPAAAPEDKLIEWNAGYAGADVYCNGVHLGKVPLKIRVGELTKKVPEWTTPPEQNVYDPDDFYYEWCPWDDFRPGQLELAKSLRVGAPKDDPAANEVRKKYRADCRFWWRFELHGSPLYVQYDDGSRYYSSNNVSVYHPSAALKLPYQIFLGRLLFDARKELNGKDKEDWEKYVLEHWRELDHDNDIEREAAYHYVGRSSAAEKEQFEAVLESLTRRRFGLSDPPTEQECQALLQTWVKEAVKDGRFSLNSGNIGEENGWQQPVVVFMERSLVDTAIRLMGDKLHKPLAEQWDTGYYRHSLGFAPLLYCTHELKSAVGFAPLVRFSAVTSTGRTELFDSNDDRIAALFNTRLRRIPNSNLLSSVEQRYHFGIRNYSRYTNPKTEPVFRRYVSEAYQYPKLTNWMREQFDKEVDAAIQYRKNDSEIDAAELSEWVSTLPWGAKRKQAALRYLRLGNQTPKTFADYIRRTYDGSDLPGTDITFEEVNRWFAEHPNETLNDFFKDKLPGIPTRGFSDKSLAELVTDTRNRRYSNTKSFVTQGEFNMPNVLVAALLATGTQESNKTLKQLYDNGQDRETVLWALTDKYQSESGRFRLAIPEEHLEMFDALETSHAAILLGNVQLSMSDFPQAGKLLARWSQSEYGALKREAERQRRIWEVRQSFRGRQKEAVLDIISGKMNPSDMLPPQPHWIWKDGDYVVVQ